MNATPAYLDSRTTANCFVLSAEWAETGRRNGKIVERERPPFFLFLNGQL